jgi:hypothetical protein
MIYAADVFTEERKRLTEFSIGLASAACTLSIHQTSARQLPLHQISALISPATR